MAEAEVIANIVARGLDSFRGALDQAKQSVQGLGGASADTGKDTGGLGKKLLGAAAAAGVTYKAYGGLKDSVNTTVNLARETAGFARASGLSQKESQAWVVTAKQRGIETKQLQIGMSTFGRNLTNVSKDGEGASKSLKALGINQQQLAALPMAERMQHVSNAFQNMADGPEKAAAAQQLFGRSGQQLLPILNSGGDALRDNLQAANDLVPANENNAQKALELAQKQRELGMATTGLKVAIGNVLIPILGPLVSAFAKVVGWVAKAVDKSPVLRVALIALAAGFIVAAAAVWVMNSALLANPITWIIVAIVGLIVGLVYLYKKCKWFRDAVNAVWAGIKKGAEWLWKNALKPVYEFFKKNWPAIWKGTKDYYKTLWSIAKRLWSVFKVVFDIVKWVVIAVIDVVKWFIGAFKWAREAEKNIIKFFAGAWKTVKQAAKDAWDWIKGAVDDVIGWVKEAGSNIAQPFIDAWEWMKQAATDAWDWIKGAFNDAVEWIKEAANDIAQPFIDAWDWISQAATDAWDWIEQAFSDVGDFFGQIPDWIIAPFQAAWEWVKNAANDAKDWVINAWNNVVNWFSQLPGKIGNFLGGLKDTIVNKFKEAAEWAWKQFEWLLDQIKGLPGKVLGFLGNLGSQIGDVLKKAVKAILPGPVADALGLQRGGVVPAGGAIARVGEAGPELMQLPGSAAVFAVGLGGEQVLPLPGGTRVTPLEQALPPIVSLQEGTSPGIDLRGLGAGPDTVHVHLEVEGREIATAVANVTANQKAAR